MREVLIYAGLPSEKRGLFHSWGFSCAESSDGNMTESLAIVELEDGSVTTVPPHQVKFLAPTEPENTALRDQFAGCRINALLTDLSRHSYDERDFTYAYELADAILKARTEKKFSRAERIAELKKEIAELNAQEAKP